MTRRSAIDFLWETPPYCPTPACYVHGLGDQEHHVEGCPMYDTTASALHRLADATNGAAVSMSNFVETWAAEMRKTWRGRAMLYWLRIRTRFIR